MQKRNNRGLITDEARKRAIASVQQFFSSERDETIGIIAAEALLDHFLDEIGKDIYNQALDDVRRWATTRAGDLEVDFAQLYR